MTLTLKRFTEIDKFLESINYKPIVTDNKKQEYYNIAAAFDIETSSFYDNEVKTATMYLWTFAINDCVIYGRTWDQFILLINNIIAHFELTFKRRLIIYVHNLGYEFQFIRKYFTFDKVFALKQRKPVYAITMDGIEFRCSYLLTGKSLFALSQSTQTKKLVGDLDYSIARHSLTHIYDKELEYAINDVLVITEYIAECIENEQYIYNIPLTKTGYVRRDCRKQCFKSYRSYKRIMDSLRLIPDEYLQLKRAFQGGFTHASAWKSGKTLGNGVSYDINSSYPACMVLERFPMSRGQVIDITSMDMFNNYINNFSCVFDVKFINIKSKVLIDHIISLSKCKVEGNHLEDNGRVVFSDVLYTTITEVDYSVLKEYYSWDEIYISNFRYYRRGYLPTPLVTTIMKYYHNKTTLKDVEGQESEYMRSKEMINSIYGMMVTDIVRDDILYDNEWNEEKAVISERIEKYNDSKKRFIFYPWGVWVTAYARRNILLTILKAGDKYIYSDTDSIKMLKSVDYSFINEYNDSVIDKIFYSSKHFGIPFEEYTPIVNGKKRIIGAFEKEYEFKAFKTLGAKRYLYLTNSIHMTVSGVSKKKSIDYLCSKYNDDQIFSMFKDGLEFPFDATGKLTMTYIDEYRSGELTDYNGVVYNYSELSSQHAEPATHTISLSSRYTDYLNSINND